MKHLKKFILLSSLTLLIAAPVTAIHAQEKSASISKSEAGVSSLEELIQLSNKALKEKQFQRAGDLLVQATRFNQQFDTHAYNAACAYAQAGAADLAFLWLEKAYNAGYNNLGHINKDSDLLTLHKDKRWTTLITKMQAQALEDDHLWNSEVWSSPYRDQLTEDERIAGLSKFWSEVKFNFIYTKTLATLDWDAVYIRYLPKVRAANSTLEYYRILMEMCALLKDGHTNVYPPQGLYDTAFTLPPLRTRLIENRLIITEVGDESLKQQGITPGVEILRINQLGFKEYGQKYVAPYASASTTQDLDLRTYTYQLFSGNINEKIQLELSDASGKIWQSEISRISGKQRSKLMPVSPNFSWKMLPGEIAYVALNSFGSDAAANEYIKAFPEISKAKAIIFDVRKNGGGSGSVGFKILSTLVNQNFDISRAYTREYHPTTRAWGRAAKLLDFGANQELPDTEHQYKGKVVILTSANTFSAAEDFAVAFDAMKRGTIIGEATGGSTGQPLVVNLPGGGTARICTKKDTYPDGKLFVGVGVQPQQVVHPTVADVRAGRDTVLDAALLTLTH